MNRVGSIIYLKWREVEFYAYPQYNCCITMITSCYG